MVTQQLEYRGLGPDQITEMATGFWVSKALFTGLELGIFDSLAACPATTESLANRLGLPSDSLQRLLGALGALKLIERVGDGWCNTPSAQHLLVRASPDFMGGLFRHFSNDLYTLWSYMPDAIRENSPRWQQAFGTKSNQNQFDALYANPVQLKGFLHMMDGAMQVAIAELLDNFDFASYRHLLDVGGALATLAIVVAQQYPNLTATVFDLPPVKPLAEEGIAAHGLEDRIDVVAGDFLIDPLPRNADIVVLGHVIRDWNDSNSVAILRRCYEALEPEGTVILLEKVLNEDRTGPVLPALMNLNMLAVTEGRERTEAEYAALLRAGGFADISLHRLNGPRDIVYAQKRCIQ